MIQYVSWSSLKHDEDMESPVKIHILKPRHLDTGADKRVVCAYCIEFTAFSNM